MDESFYQDARLHWRDGHDTIEHVDITASAIAVRDHDGRVVHFHEADDDPDGTPAYKEDEPTDDDS
jgi:hypothetical protein